MDDALKVYEEKVFIRSSCSDHARCLLKQGFH